MCVSDWRCLSHSFLPCLLTPETRRRRAKSRPLVVFVRALSVLLPCVRLRLDLASSPPLALLPPSLCRRLLSPIHAEFASSLSVPLSPSQPVFLSSPLRSVYCLLAFLASTANTTDSPLPHPHLTLSLSPLSPLSLSLLPSSSLSQPFNFPFIYPSPDPHLSGVQSPAPHNLLSPPHVFSISLCISCIKLGTDVHSVIVRCTRLTKSLCDDKQV